jgi:hypothetical protein
MAQSPGALGKPLSVGVLARSLAKVSVAPNPGKSWPFAWLRRRHSEAPLRELAVRLGLSWAASVPNLARRLEADLEQSPRLARELAANMRQVTAQADAPAAVPSRPSRPDGPECERNGAAWTRAAGGKNKNKDCPRAGTLEEDLSLASGLIYGLDITQPMARKRDRPGPVDSGPGGAWACLPCINDASARGGLVLVRGSPTCARVSRGRVGPREPE